MIFKNKKIKILNFLYNGLISNKYPISLTHFITERCNARCPHCFIDFKTKKEEMSLENIEKISSTTGNCLKNVSLTGGEPFLRDDIFEIAEIWYKNSTVDSVVIPTNGSLPDKIENFLKSASKVNLPLFFFFSYDFIGEKHSKYRGINDLHNKVLESYKIVKSYGNKFKATFQITLSPENYQSAFETYKYIRDVLHVKNINCPLIRGEKTKSFDVNLKNDLIQVYKKIQNQINTDYNNGIFDEYENNSLTKAALNVKNKMMWKYISDTFINNKYVSPCKAGSLTGIILSNADVFPCELLNEKIGNLKDFDYNFLDLWQSLNADKIRNNIFKTKCFCTYECSWFLNIFSYYKYYPEIFYYLIRNVIKK